MTKKKHGNSKFSIELFNQICDEIALSSKGLKFICQDFGITSRAFYKWLREDDKKEDGKALGLVQIYTHARDEQAHLLADEIISISDDSKEDTIETFDKHGKKIKIEDKEWTSRSKLRVDSRKFIASKLMPKKYGDKVDITSGGEKIQTITGMQINNTESKEDDSE